MNAILDRLRANARRAWLLFLQWLNWIMAAVAAFEVAYPHAVDDTIATLPPPLKLAAMALWFAVVHYALRRAKKEA